MIPYKEMMKNRTLDEYSKFDYLYYYNTWNLQYYFIKFLKNRELMFLPAKKQRVNPLTVRNMRVHNIQSFQFWLKFVNAFKYGRLVNMYYSLAEFKDGIPYRDTSEGNLKEDWEAWNNKADKEIVSYDVLIDVDCDSFDFLDYALESAKNIKTHFDFYRIPYKLRFSGRGFHFVIPFRYFDIPFGKEFMKYIRRVVKHLRDNITEMIDLSVSDYRRVTKLPMSISIYDEGNYVCSPVEDLDNFKLENFEAKNFKYLRAFPMDITHNFDGDLRYFNGKV